MSARCNLVHGDVLATSVPDATHSTSVAFERWTLSKKRTARQIGFHKREMVFIERCPWAQCGTRNRGVEQCCGGGQICELLNHVIWPCAFDCRAYAGKHTAGECSQHLEGYHEAAAG